jgi:predicted phage terminase large subunit-like protein
LWLQSWDFTFKGSAGSDFVAGGVWLYSHPDAYLVDQVCARMSFVEACQAMIDMSRRYPLAVTKIVEDKANGPAVEDVLRSQVGGIVLVNPQGGKEARAHAISGLFQAGNVFLPRDATWLQSYRAQLTAFPRGINDDMVDQTSQALLRVAHKHGRYVDAMTAVRGWLK